VRAAGFKTTPRYRIANDDIGGWELSPVLQEPLFALMNNTEELIFGKREKIKFGAQGVPLFRG
jgi:hypothetical protein